MWLTTEQVIELGVSRRTLFRKLDSGEWKSREAGRSRNGRPVREVLLSSLPDEMQSEWARRNAGEAEPVEGEQAAGDEQGDGLTKALTRYPAELRDALIAEVNRLNKIMDRFDAIEVKSTVNDANRRVFAPAVESLCREAVCPDPTVLAREPRRGKVPSPFTLENWSRRRRKEGLAVFLRSAPKSSADDGRRADFSPEAEEWMQRNWRNYPTQSHLIKKLRKLATRNKWKLPSDATLRRVLNDVPAVVKAAVFGTDKDYTSKYKPHVPRTVEDLAALQIVCGDHHVLDVHCWSDGLKQLVRLWLTGWQDMRTGLVWGYHLDHAPSSHTIACAYANGVRQFGAQPFSRPADGYVSFAQTDNGKDYKSRNLAGEIEVHRQAARIDGGLQLLLTTQKVGILADAEVEHMLARKFNGREKPIERTFGDLATAVQNEFFRRGWCGRDAKKKPDAWREMWVRHEKAVKAGRPSPFPAEAEVRSFVAGWIDDYNTSTHLRSTLGGARVVPLTEFNRLYPARFDISDEKLALMLLKPTRGTIGKNGVRILGGTYSHPILSEFKGKKGPDGKPLQIEARYSDEDYTAAWLILPDGRICEALRLDPSSVLTPNKETHKAVARLTKHEAKLIRDFNLLTQSHIRGESVEDRAAALLEVVTPAEIEMPIAVGENQAAKPTVRRLTRLDARKLRAVPAGRKVTAEEVARVEGDGSIFNTRDRGKVKEFDFDD